MLNHSSRAGDSDGGAVRPRESAHSVLPAREAPRVARRRVRRAHLVRIHLLCVQWALLCIRVNRVCTRLYEYMCAFRSGSYLKTDAYASEVPRLLFEQSPQQLEKFLQAQMQAGGSARADPKLLKWWAAYLESVGELELALKFYALCDDAYSMIRIHLHRHNLNKAPTAPLLFHYLHLHLHLLSLYLHLHLRAQALEICSQTGNLAGCYFLAAHFEKEGDNDRALAYYIQAQCFSQAARLCKCALAAASPRQPSVARSRSRSRSRACTQGAREGRPAHEHRTARARRRQARRRALLRVAPRRARQSRAPLPQGVH